MSRYKVVADEALEIVAGEPLAGFYQLSPYVWREEDRFRIALRAVNHSDVPEEKVSRVYFGSSEDGLSFAMRAEPELYPSPGPDSRGCEDPTIERAGETLQVIYSGWDGEASRMLRASGPGTERLTKHGPMWPDDPRFANPKEAGILRVPDGVRVLFEYARDGASRIGSARAERLDGAYALEEGPIGPRDDHWDSWHLSPCDGVVWEGRRILIYSGADKETNWRIGWAELDEGERAFSTGPTRR